LGAKSNSVGYLSNGRKVIGGSEQTASAKSEPKSSLFADSFSSGDVVGCGLVHKTGLKQREI
jgi:hypothetical protein